MRIPNGSKYPSAAEQVRAAIALLKSIWHAMRAWVQEGRFWTELSRLLSRHSALQAGVYWVGATVAGLVAVIYSEFFDLAAGLCRTLLNDHPYVLFSIGPFFFVLSRWLVVRFAPAAGGSGIPHVIAACSVEPPYCDHWVGIRVGIVKILSSLAALLGGGVLGREGPTIQISAGIFYSLGKRFRHIWPNLNSQSLLIAGGAAGIAAAFNTPLGGIVYAIEELSDRNFHRFKTMLISAVIISGLVAQGFQGTYLFFGFPRMPLVTVDMLPWALAVGLIIGLLGGVFGKFLRVIARRAERMENNGRLWLAFAMGLLLPLAAWWVGPEMFGGGTSLIRHLLFDEDKQISWGLVAARFFGPLATFSSGVACGIFAPSLSAGAALGAKIAQLSHTTNANFFILLGMISFLSGVTRAPFTSFVLVMEMTDRHSAIFAMMLASLAASLIAKIVDSRSFYERSAGALIRTLPKEAQKRKKKKPQPVPVPEPAGEYVFVPTPRKPPSGDTH